MKKLIDKYYRDHDYLRISLTDRCNLNCIYCNPFSKCENKLDKSEILTFKEISRLIEIFVNSGFKKIRFTGGEPLARKDIIKLFDEIYDFKQKNNFDLSITTNASLPGNSIEEMKHRGLDRINISLDSLKKKIFREITKSDSLEIVMSNIEKAKNIGFKSLKINTVVLKGINDNEILDFCNFAINEKLNVRFIEFMPFSNNGWLEIFFISAVEIKNIISEKFKLEKIDNSIRVADEYKIAGTEAIVGFISSISNHFCNACNRLRITADGILKLCLFSSDTELLDLKSLLRNENVSDENIYDAVANHLQIKESEHKPLYELINLKNNNMLKIGG